MRIVCPQCGYSREISASKIPARSSVATCPKCRFRFRFREDSSPAPNVVNAPPSNAPAYPPSPSRPSPAPSPEDMRSTPPPYFAPLGVTYRPLPDDVWEPKTRPPRTLKSTARWLPDPEPGEESPTPRQPESDRRGQERDSGPWPEPPQRSWVRPEKDAGSRWETNPIPKEEPPRSWRPAPKPKPGVSVDQETDAQGFSGRPVDVRRVPGHEPDEERVADAKPDSDHEAQARTEFVRPVDHVPNEVVRDQAEPADFGGEDDVAPRAGGPAPEAVYAPQREPVFAPEPSAPHAPEAETRPEDEFSREEPVSVGRHTPSDTAGLDASGASLSELGEALRGEEPGLTPDPEPSPPPEPPRPPKPPEPDFWESARTASRTPHEATTGDEPVRDIWARLQAMGGDPVPSPPPGKESKKPPKEVSHVAEAAAPWDEFEQVGVAPAFLKTVRNVLFKPGDFFENLNPEAGRVRPLIYAMAVSELVALFWMIWKFFGLGPAFSELTRTEGFQGLGVSGLGSLAFLGLAPVLMVGFSFLDAALSHFLLGLLRGVTRPFEATFRMLCYAGTPWLLAAAPVPLQYLLPVVIIWHMALQAIGLKKQHQSGYSQVLASVLVKWSFYLMVFFALYVLALRA
ncbi:hypothetical protein JCM15519_15180 [Fundidesulfovibrio butyratiphilus]